MTSMFLTGRGGNQQGRGRGRGRGRERGGYGNGEQSNFSSPAHVVKQVEKVIPSPLPTTVSESATHIKPLSSVPEGIKVNLLLLKFMIL